MKIRFAKHDDVETLLALSSQLHAESRFSHRPLDQEKVRKAIWSSITNTKHSCILIAETGDGSAVGFLAGVVLEYFFCEGWMAQDQSFYVARSHRGSPAALKLLISFRKWAELKGVEELCINMSVAIDMERFNKLMSHMGFKCCGSNFSIAI